MDKNFLEEIMHTVNLNGKVIGKIENNIFSKTGNILWMNKSIGTDVAIMDELESRGITKIIVKAKNDKNKIYETDLSTVKEFGVIRDLGYGKQIFLSLNHWRR